MSTVTHASWCTDHIHGDADPRTYLDEWDECESKVLNAHGVEVTVENGNDHGVVVDLYAKDANLTPAQAREVAAAILKAADIVEESYAG